MVGACGWDVVDVAIVVPGAAAAAGAAPIPNRAARFFNFSSIGTNGCATADRAGAVLVVAAEGLVVALPGKRNKDVAALLLPNGPVLRPPKPPMVLEVVVVEVIDGFVALLLLLLLLLWLLWLLAAVAHGVDSDGAMLAGGAVAAVRWKKDNAVAGAAATGFSGEDCTCSVS